MKDFEIFLLIEWIMAIGVRGVDVLWEEEVDGIS